VKSGTDLGLNFFRQSAPAAVAWLVLIMLPHVIGAPELEHVETNVPSSLSHQFVIAVTLTSLVFWAVLGGLTSTIFACFDRESLAQHRLHA
jgi:predicted cobalt transporter CbtA